MEYILNKKNIPILRYSENKGYIEVLQVYNKEHLPVALFLNGKPSADNLYALNEKMEQFLDNRLIPSTRPHFKEALEELEIPSNYELAKKSWFLSLSDQYWICPIELKDKLFWEDINFFTNEYDSAIGLRLTSKSKSLNRNSSLYSPDNVTNGELSKRWFKKDGINYLEKAGTGTEQQEPLNEILASEICRRLNIAYVPYYLTIRDDKYFCYCLNMIDESTELIPMDAFYQDLHLVDGKFYDYKQLIKSCEDLQIPNAEEDLLKIILVDYIMANIDRHSYNISFIRDSNTLQWKGIAPVYDTGKSMFLNLLDFEMNMISSGQIGAKPFYETQSEQISKLPPDPEKKISKKNNPKMTFDKLCCEKWIFIARSHGLEIEDTPKPREESGKTLEEFQKEKDLLRNRVYTLLSALTKKNIDVLEEISKWDELVPSIQNFKEWTKERCKDAQNTYRDSQLDPIVDLFVAAFANSNKAIKDGYDSLIIS